MPIPHLSQKIHSPKAWKGDPVLRLRKKAAKQFFDIKRMRKPKKGSFWKTLGKLLKRYWRPLLFLLLFGFLLLAILFAWYSKDLPKPDRLASKEVAQSTKIYDRSGEHLLYEIHGEQKRTLIPLKELPPYAIKATLALEDQRFYEHSGFSLWSIARGVILNTLRGRRVQGGSTLTQQLVKNAILTNERSVERKIKELILSYQLEKKYSKDEILQLYFNEIPYGSTAYGIEAAANTYFGKGARELTLAEAALLAALPQRPSYLSPYGSHEDELYGRQQYALSQMVKLGYITEAEAQAAKQEKINFKQKIEGITAPHFVFYVKSLLSEKYGEKMVEQGGLKIISTIDWDLQKKAEEIVTEQAEKNLKDFQAGNAALVSLDVKTGQILAMVGSKDFFDETIDGQVNVAISPRQPGSSFKPIVYTTAWLRGYVPETVVYDLETTFPTLQGNYQPHNYDLKEYGPVSLRQALAGSLNIPAVKMIYLAGIDNVLNLADQLGYTTLKDRSRFGLSLVLGGGEVSLLEHTNAFAALARDGKTLPTTPILKLEENNGHLLEQFLEERPQKIMEPDIARITTDVLSDNSARAFIFGENNYLTLPDRPVAAKTGTTNDYHDAWTIGYTPQIATGVWVGNSNNDAMKKGADGSKIAAPIWQKFMIAALANKPAENFTKPSYIIPNKPMLGGEAAGLKVKINKLNGLLATATTSPDLIEEKTFKQARSILRYVNKDDPLGPVPEKPENDPYYKYWEESVAKWAAGMGIVNEEPPTALDNSSALNDQPPTNSALPSENNTLNIKWLNPTVSTSLKTGDFPYTLMINIKEIDRVEKIDFYYRSIDNQSPTGLIGSASLETNNSQVSWIKPPANGTYQVYPLITDKAGQKIIGPEITISIE